MELTDKYVGWARFIPAGEFQRKLETCDSDSEGAFKIFKEATIEEAYLEGRSYQAKIELQGRDRFIASLKKKSA